METLSLLLVFFVLLSISQYKKISELKTEANAKQEVFNANQSIMNIQERTIYRLEIDIENKKGTIKFLSEQNIILNNELEILNDSYSKNSDAIINERLKKGEQSFRLCLQKSREVADDNH